MRRSLLALLLLAGAARAAQDQPVYVDLYVNEAPKDSILVRLRGDDVLAPVADLERDGLTGFTGQREEIDGKTHVALRSLAPGIVFRFDEPSLELRLTAQSQLLPVTRLDLAPVQRPRDLVLRTDTSAFANYAVQYGSPDVISTFGELGVSVRGNLLYSGLSQTTSGFSRGLSNFTVDQPEQMRRWVAGDSFASTGTLGASLLLGGVSVSRNFGLDPYFVRSPLPRVSGAVLTPSTLDVYVNGVLVRREPLPPGPFEIANLPVTSGLSGVQYVLHDAFGRTQEYSTRAYSSPTVLAKGLSDYSYNLGVERDDFGTSSFSYGRPVLLAQHRLGLTDRITAGYRLEADPGLVSAGPTLSLALPLGQVDLSAAGSIKDGSWGAGGSAAYVLATRPAAFGVSVRAMTPRYANAALDPLADRPLLDASAFASLTMGRLTLALDYGASYMRDAGVNDLLQARADIRVSRRATFSVTAGRSRSPGQDGVLQTTAGLVYSFDEMTVANTSATAQTGGNSASASVQRGLPIGDGLGYIVQGDSGASDHFGAQVLANAPFGHYEASFQRFGPDNASSLSAAGSLVLAGDRLFLARPVQDGFAVLRVPGLPGVRGYLNNVEVGTTDSRGDLFIPNLLPYYGNRLSIRDGDVPMDYEVGKVERLVASPYRGGALVEFDVHRIQSVTGVLELEGGVSPAYGELQISAGGKDLVSPISAEGRFWLEGVPVGSYAATAGFRGGTCTVRIEVPRSAGPLYDLGRLRCGPPNQVAAH
ncbi:MAG TPA: fimbria/pilus outer membrane usher protein [Myxococcales bacterium]|nr:fimbria/pilus outer membrane usher protein [Myxococcales bacterium]